jgi:hypothetical protein
MNVYLPFVAGGKGDIQPGVTLPAKLIGTWFTGNAPLNDFYNPTTGEWRDVSGVGQMYLFSGNGDYTYTAFARFQTGACKSEVSVFKQGIAYTEGDALTLKANQSKTRTVTICPTPNESITEGSQDPVTMGWSVAANDSGIVIFTTIEQGAEETVHTEFKKVGMAESLVGVWHTDALTPDGFYDPTTKSFNLDSPAGIWYEFVADSTYRYGKHSSTYPDAEGCILEEWVYQTGTIKVIGGSITIEPKDGVLRLVNSCGGDPVITDPWVPESNNFAWYHSDLSDDIKLVMIQLMPFREYIFKR